MSSYICLDCENYVGETFFGYTCGSETTGYCDDCWKKRPRTRETSIEHSVKINELDEKVEYLECYAEASRGTALIHGHYIEAHDAEINALQNESVRRDEDVKNLQDTVLKYGDDIKSLQDGSVKGGQVIKNLEGIVLRCGENLKKLQDDSVKQSEDIGHLQDTTSRYGEDFKKLQDQLDSIMEKMELATELEKQRVQLEKEKLIAYQKELEMEKAKKEVEKADLDLQKADKELLKAEKDKEKEEVRERAATKEGENLSKLDDIVEKIKGIKENHPEENITALIEDIHCGHHSPVSQDQNDEDQSNVIVGEENICDPFSDLNGSPDAYNPNWAKLHAGRSYTTLF